MSKIYGDIGGIRKNLLDEIENLYDISVPSNQFITVELVNLLVSFTTQINREIAIYINRRGQIIAIAIGDLRTVSLPDIDTRRSNSRLNGVRCIHTHLNANSLLSEVDISALKLRRFDIMAAIGVVEKNIEISFGFISGLNGESFAVDIVGPISVDQLLDADFMSFIRELDRQLANTNRLESTAQVEKAIITGIDQSNGWAISESLRELSQLAETAGAEVVDVVWQKRERPDSSLFIGRGKVQEIALLIQNKDANVVIIDDEISPAQQRNLEHALGVKVIDRTALILDIFAQRARTYEGKLQVELAQLQYNLPRLGGQGLVLSRLGGGIGTRGPGETKLEVDRRKIRGRISEIRREIETIKKQRDLHRRARQISNIPSIALVGYTNAGKSTLLNTLANAGVLAEDKLFATLDPTTRRITLPNGLDIIATDTVGFIQKLPHHLVVAFRATLEEVVQADLLIHVIDASHPQHIEQSEAVFKVLEELGVKDKPIITVYNKADKADQHVLERLLRTEDSVAISAVTGESIDLLENIIQERVKPYTVDMEFLIPYNDTGVLSQLYDEAVVQIVDYREEGIYVRASLTLEKRARFESFVIGDV